MQGRREWGGLPQGPLGSDDRDQDASCLPAGSSPSLAGATSRLERGNDFASTVRMGVETESWVLTHLSNTLLPSCPFLGTCVGEGEVEGEGLRQRREAVDYSELPEGSTWAPESVPPLPSCVILGVISSL